MSRRFVSLGVPPLTGVREARVISADFHAGRPTQPDALGGGMVGALTWSTSDGRVIVPEQRRVIKLRSAAHAYRVRQNCSQTNRDERREQDELTGGGSACSYLVRQPDHRNRMAEGARLLPDSPAVSRSRHARPLRRISCVEIGVRPPATPTQSERIRTSPGLAGW